MLELMSEFSKVAGYEINIQRQMFLVLFVIAKNWKPLKCPSLGKHINKLWYIYTK